MNPASSESAAKALHEELKHNTENYPTTNR
jgi:hypothetical protein